MDVIAMIETGTRAITLVDATTTAFKSLKKLIGLKASGDKAISDRIAEIDAQLAQLHQINLSLIKQNTALAKEHNAAEKRVIELEDELMAARDWEEEAQKYELREYLSGTFARVQKPAFDGEQPSHRICANCYEAGQRRFFSFAKSEFGFDELECPACKTRVCIPNESRAEVFTTGEGSDWDAY